MAVSDWQAWAASTDRRLLSLESQLPPELRSTLIDLKAGVVEMVISQKRLHAIIEQFAKVTLDEAELSKMNAELKESNKTLDEARKLAGPE